MNWLFALLLCLASTTLEAASRAYVGDPLPVLLPVGQERRVEVEGAQEIRVGLSGALKEWLHVESAGPHVWLTAKKVLAPQRLYLETEAGALVLEIRTDGQAPTGPLTITVASKHPGPPPSLPSDHSIGYVALARHAIQALYAADLHGAPIPGMRVIPIDVRPVALFRCRKGYPSACGDAVESTLHAAWEAPPYYVTAVMVRNRLPEPLMLDLRDIRGRFAASTLVHSRLEAAGSVRDTTTVVLVSHTPFENAQ